MFASGCMSTMPPAQPITQVGVPQDDIRSCVVAYPRHGSTEPYLSSLAIHHEHSHEQQHQLSISKHHLNISICGTLGCSCHMRTPTHSGPSISASRRTASSVSEHVPILSFPSPQQHSSHSCPQMCRMAHSDFRDSASTTYWSN